LVEIESDFIFLFLISEINFRLKIIPGNPEILIKSRKYSESSKKPEKLLEMIWVMMNPNKVFGAHEIDFRAF
jgi:hypothetical protein